MAACVLARKSEWLRNACLAAALIVPAVAAFHGIALAALHVDGKSMSTKQEYVAVQAILIWFLSPEGAIDLDIYGAFQLCSIGILAVPVTTRLSTTYFYDPGRNVIFLWTGIVLAGEQHLFSVIIDVVTNAAYRTSQPDGRVLSVESNTMHARRGAFSIRRDTMRS